MGAYRTIIGFNPNQFDTGSFEPTRYLVLDTQEDKNITASAKLAQQPLQNGDTITDHMYRDPVRFSISGHFSLNGKNWDDDSYNFMEKGDRLTNIQEVFEYIKNNGFLCRLTTIDEEDVLHEGQGTSIRVNAKTRFKTRNNMALESINWKEKQNTVSYTFSFTEVIMVEKQEYEDLIESEREELGLPHVSSPVGSSLGTVLANTGQLHRIIISTLYENGYIENDFLRVLCEGGVIIENYLIFSAIITVGLTFAVITAVPAALAVAAAATEGTVAMAAALAGSVSAVFPVGTVVIAVVAVVAAIAVFITNIVQWHEQQWKQDRIFKLINGSADQDCERLVNLLEDVEKRVNQCKTNLTIYNINGNYRQIVTLNIGGEYYLIEFDQNNAEAGESWGAIVTDMEGNTLNTVRHAWCPVSSFGDLDRNQNLWFKDKSLQYEVYLVNPSLSPEVNDTQEKINNAKQNLEGYSIWVSKGNIQKNIQNVKDAINKAITEEGYI